MNCRACLRKRACGVSFVKSRFLAVQIVLEGGRQPCIAWTQVRQSRNLSFCGHAMAHRLITRWKRALPGIGPMGASHKSGRLFQRMLRPPLRQGVKPRHRASIHHPARRHSWRRLFSFTILVTCSGRFIQLLTPTRLRVRYGAA